MSFELILPFLRPIEPLLLDDSISEIMGNPDASWWYERDGIMRQDATISFNAGQLRTGLEVTPNHLAKNLRGKAFAAPPAPRRKPPGGGDSSGCAPGTCPDNQKVHQPALHDR